MGIRDVSAAAVIRSGVHVDMAKDVRPAAGRRLEAVTAATNVTSVSTAVAFMNLRVADVKYFLLQIGCEFFSR